jgi:glycosyltransferase involved in cell wall biosynthesis
MSLQERVSDEQFKLFNSARRLRLVDGRWNPERELLRGRVLHIGGAHTLGQIAREQLINLRAMDWDVHVACEEVPAWTSGLSDAGLPVLPLPIPHRAGIVDALRAARPLAEMARRLDIDIIHTNNAHHGVVGRMVARAIGKRSVHTWRYNPLDATSQRSKQLVFGTIEGLASRAGDRVLFQNHEDLASAIKQRIVPESRATWIGNGIQVHKYGRLSATRDAVRSTIGVGDAAEVITCVARLTERKGQKHLVGALPLILDARPNVHLVLVGTAPTEAEWHSEQRALKAQAEAAGVSHRVHFAGHRDDIPDVLKASDVICLPSRREGVPRVLMESMAAGTPIIASDVVGTRELIQNGRTGLLFPYADHTALAQSALRMLSDSGLRDRCRQEAKEAVAANWSAGAVTKRIDAVYRELLA